MKTELNKDFLVKVEDFSNTILIKKNDLQILIEESSKGHLEKEFEELAFTAKYVEGLKRVLAKGSEFKEIENLDYAKKDLSENMEKIIDQVRNLVSDSSEQIKNYFEETYLKLNPQCFQNLNELTANLELVKKYLNYQKRSE